MLLSLTPQGAILEANGNYNLGQIKLLPTGFYKIIASIRSRYVALLNALKTKFLLISLL